MSIGRSRGAAPTAKPRNDAYTGLLGLSLVALIAASVLLYLDYSEFNQTTTPSASPPSKIPTNPDFTPQTNTPAGIPGGAPPGPGGGNPGLGMHMEPPPVLPELPKSLPPALPQPPAMEPVMVDATPPLSETHPVSIPSDETPQKPIPSEDSGILPVTVELEVPVMVPPTPPSSPEAIQTANSNVSSPSTPEGTQVSNSEPQEPPMPPAKLPQLPTEANLDPAGVPEPPPLPMDRKFKVPSTND